ncbi:hypothetical protein ABPG72_018332 [Tetrahymena utriculariae]
MLIGILRSQKSNKREKQSMISLKAQKKNFFLIENKFSSHFPSFKVNRRSNVKFFFIVTLVYIFIIYQIYESMYLENLFPQIVISQNSIQVEGDVDIDKKYHYKIKNTLKLSKALLQINTKQNRSKLYSQNDQQYVKMLEVWNQVFIEILYHASYVFLSRLNILFYTNQSVEYRNNRKERFSLEFYCLVIMQLNSSRIKWRAKIGQLKDIFFDACSSFKLFNNSILILDVNCSHATKSQESSKYQKKSHQKVLLKAHNSQRRQKKIFLPNKLQTKEKSQPISSLQKSLELTLKTFLQICRQAQIEYI